MGDVTESARSCLGIHQSPQCPPVPSLPSFHMPRGHLPMRQEQKSVRNGHSADVGDLRATIQDAAGIFGSFNPFYLTSHAWVDERLSWCTWDSWGQEETGAVLQESKIDLDEPRSEVSSCKFSKPRASGYIQESKIRHTSMK